MMEGDVARAENELRELRVEIRQLRADLQALEHRMRDALRMDVHELDLRIFGRIETDARRLDILERWQAELAGASRMGKVIWVAAVVIGGAIYHIVVTLFDYWRRHP